MYINRVKNFSIILLTLLAIYLTGQLWFGKFSNRNFFYTVMDTFKFSAPENLTEQHSFVPPASIITGFGNKTYQIIYNDLRTNDARKISDEIMKEVLKNGDFVNSGILNYENILNNKFCSYSYEFSLKGEFLSGSFGIKSGNTSSKIESFNSIFFIPGRNTDNTIRVIFVDEIDKQFYEFKVTSSELNKGLLDGISKNEESKTAVFYISSKDKEKEGYNVFKNNTFVAEWVGESFAYNPIVSDNPYAYNGDVLLDGIETKVDVFFNNPSEKYKGRPSKIFTFSDENIAVKYYPNDVLEYSDYSIRNSKIENISFLEAFYIAKGFIEDEGVITNRIYLANYIEEDESYTFYFNYAINNFPMKLSDNLKNSLEMNYPLEIKIEKDASVTKYKKWVYSFKVDEDYVEKANTGFWDTYNDIIFSIEAQDTVLVDSLTIGYNIDDKEYYYLSWFLDANNKSYLRPAKIFLSADKKEASF